LTITARAAAFSFTVQLQIAVCSFIGGSKFYHTSVHGATSGILSAGREIIQKNFFFAFSKNAV